MSLIELARKLRPIIEQAAQSLTDETALDAVELFPEWKAGQPYTSGQRLRHKSILYSILQNHTSQEDWPPDTATSLFAKVLIPDPNDIPEWEQPDSTNPYMAGDTVAHTGKVWTSDIDNNVWEPGVYGWTEAA